MESIRSELSAAKLFGDIRNWVVIYLLFGSGLGAVLARYVSGIYEQGWAACIIAGIVILFLLSVAGFLFLVLYKAWKKEPVFYFSEPFARSFATALAASAERALIKLPPNEAEQSSQPPEPKAIVTGEELLAMGDDAQTILELHAHHARTGGKLTVCADISAKLLGITWDHRRRIRLFEAYNFVNNESFVVPLISRLEKENDSRFGWGAPHLASAHAIDMKSRDPVRCRVAFIDEVGDETYFYFMFLRTGSGTPPHFTVIDAKTFGTPRGWFSS